MLFHVTVWCDSTTTTTPPDSSHVLVTHPNTSYTHNSTNNKLHLAVHWFCAPCRTCYDSTNFGRWLHLTQSAFAVYRLDTVVNLFMYDSLHIHTACDAWTHTHTHTHWSSFNLLLQHTRWSSFSLLFIIHVHSQQHACR